MISRTPINPARSSHVKLAVIGAAALSPGRVFQINHARRSRAHSATTFMRRRLCCPASGLAAAENFDLLRLSYSSRQLFSPPISPSLLLQAVHGVPVKDSVSSSVSSWHWLSSHRLLAPETHSCDSHWLEQLISLPLSTLLPILPAAVSVSSWPVSVAPLADVFRVAGFSSSTFSAS